MTRRKKSMPTMILWDRRSQLRFVEAVERLSSIVNDLETRKATKKPKRARDGSVEKCLAEMMDRIDWLDSVTFQSAKSIHFMEDFLKRKKLWDEFGQFLQAEEAKLSVNSEGGAA